MSFAIAREPQGMVKGLFAKPQSGDVDMVKNGREKRIRTSGPCLPKAVLYQAELFPDR
jgi:hypothetical protein